MAAATSLSTFDGTATPPTNFATPTGKSDMDEASGVATPSTYAADCAMVYTGATYANGRFQIQIKNEFKAAVTLLFKLASSSDLTADHGEVVFTPGSAVAPAWNVPDTITIKKRVSGTTSTITPTNTADGNSAWHPSIVGTTIACRHKRLAANDVLEVDPVDDQVVVRINHVPYAHEEVTGLPSSTEYVGLISHAGSATTQAYDNAKGGALVGRYVNKSTGSDSNSGLSAAPWATLAKGITAQAAGEMVFVHTANFTESLAVYASPGIGFPRSGATAEDPIAMFAKAGATVENAHSLCFHAKTTAVGVFVSYNIGYRNTSASGGSEVIKFFESAGPLYLIGGYVKDAWEQGIQFSSNATYAGKAHLVRDVLLKGNGRKDGFTHGAYSQGQNTIFEYCTVDAASTAFGNSSKGYGFHIYNSNSSASTWTSGSIVRYCLVFGHTGSGRAGILLGRGTNLYAIGNRCYGNSVGMEIGFEANNGQAINNVLYSNTTVGLQLGGSNAATNSKAYNNTLYGNGTYGLYNYANSTSAVATNNIAFGNTTDQIFDAGSGLTETTNLETTPGFANAAGGDFTLASGAAAATGGTDLSASMDAIDVMGYARPQGATWARGAFELPDPATNPIVSVGNVSGNVDASIAFPVSVLGQGNVAIRARINRSSTDLVITPVADAGTSVTRGGG